MNDEMLMESMAATQDMKKAGKEVLREAMEDTVVPNGKKVTFVAVACDAGMGSSAMGASLIRNHLHKAGIDIRVENFSIEHVPSDADVVVLHENLLERAKANNPQLRYVPIKNYMNDPAETKLVDEIKKQYGK